MKIQFNFELGDYNGLMRIIICQDKDILFDSAENTQTSLSAILDITKISDLIIKISGKNEQVDTQVNSAGEILADKYVRLSSMLVGRLPVTEENLYKICQYSPNNKEKLYHTYWGFNGQVTVGINSLNPIMWHAHNNPGLVIS